MELYQVIYQVSMLVAAAVMLGLAFYAWQQRTAGGRRTFALLAAILAIRMASSSFALSGSNYLVISDIRYICDAAVPVLWFLFVVLYLGHRQWLTRPVLILLLAFPAATLALVVTNPTHGLVWTAVTLTPTAPFTVLVKSPGPWFWGHGIFSVVLTALSTGLAGMALVRAPQHHRAQAALLLVSSLVFLGGAVVLGPALHVEFAPQLAITAALLTTVGVFGFRLLGIFPDTCVTLFESLPNALIMLDEHKHIAEINSAARELISGASEHPIGQAFPSVFSDWSELTALPVGATSTQSYVIRRGNTGRWFEARLAPLHNRPGTVNGHLILLTDITDKKLADDRQTEATRQVQTLADLSRAIGEAGLNQRTILETVAQLIGERIGDICVIMLLSEDRLELDPVAIYHRDAKLRDELRRILMSGALKLREHGRRVVSTGELTQVQFDGASPGAQEIHPDFAAYAMRLGIHSLLSVPLRTQDQILGILSVARQFPQSTYTKDEQHLLENIADRAALAIDNARLYHLAQRELNERIQAVDTLRRRLQIEQLASTLSARFIDASADKMMDELAQAVRAVGETVDADRCLVALFRFDPLKLDQYIEWHAAGRPDWSAEDATQVIATYAWSMERLASQEVARVHNLGDLPPGASTERQVWLKGQVRSVIMLPLIIDGRMAGAFGLCAEQADRHWQDDDIALMKVFSGLFASFVARSATERALRDSEGKLRGIIENSQDGISLIDEWGCIIEWNPRLERMLGLPRDAVINRPAWEILKPVVSDPANSDTHNWQNLEGVKHILATQADSNSLCPTEQLIRLPDGTLGWIEHIVFPIRTANGLMLANIVRDVTDRKQTADRLRQQATYLETLLESSVGAIIAYSPDGRVLSWNRAAEHIYGWARHEVIGHPLPVVPGNLAAHNEQILNSVVDGTTTVYNAELRRQRRDGTEVYVLASLSPIRNADGSLDGVLDFSMDITERKALEEQQRLRQQTDLVIREREHLARELHDSLGQRLSYLKLQAVAARDALARGVPDDADMLLRRLTEVAQDTQTEVRLQIRSLFGDTVDGERFASTIRAYATSFPDTYGVAVDTCVAPEWSSVVMDHDTGFQLLRIAQEALVNIGRHSGAKHATVALSTVDGHIRVQIEDNGRGFDLEQASQHADEHFGLRIMRQRARDIGAELCVDSAPGAGTRISISAAGRPAQWPETA